MNILLLVLLFVITACLVVVLILKSVIEKRNESCKFLKKSKREKIITDRGEANLRKDLQAIDSLKAALTSVYIVMAAACVVFLLGFLNLPKETLLWSAGILATAVACLLLFVGLVILDEHTTLELHPILQSGLLIVTIAIAAALGWWISNIFGWGVGFGAAVLCSVIEFVLIVIIALSDENLSRLFSRKIPVGVIAWPLTILFTAAWMTVIHII